MVAPIPSGLMDTRAESALDDRALMERAIALAHRCESETGKVSPKVGAAIARDGVVIGEAFRGELAPGDHAEFTLLEKKLAAETLAGATLFTTLEPCTVRNEPKLACAERIIERRIAKVVIGVLDPNDAIRGRGELRLRDAGIQIARFDSDLMAQIEELNRDFARLHAGAPQTRRSKAQTSDPADPGQIGPNGHRIGYRRTATRSNGSLMKRTPGSSGLFSYAVTMSRSSIPITSSGKRSGGIGTRFGARQLKVVRRR